MIHKPFYFVRHGQTDWNVEKRLMGQQDIALNDVGRKQAQKIRKLIDNYQIMSVFYSSLLRARQTAEIIAHEQPYAMHQVTNLQERGFGEWEGSLIDPFMVELTRAELLPPTAESLALFRQRIQQAMQEVFLSPKPVLVVSHGEVFRMLCILINVEPWDIPNCLIVRFTPLPKGWKIETTI